MTLIKLYIHSVLVY